MDFGSHNRLSIKTSALILALVFVLACVFAVVFFTLRADSGAQSEPASGDIMEFTVAGGSMEPVLHSGQAIRVHMAAYQDAPVGRGDIILIAQPGDAGYLVKFVKAIPGDTLALAKAEGGSHILINGEVLANSENEPYLLSEAKAAMLGLYSRDYGTIPEGAYVVLGNHISGSDDSTVFGLVDVIRIKGQVLTE